MINKLISVLFLLLTTTSFGQAFDDWTSDSISNWMDLRINNANNNTQETVEMPFAVRSLGWGCLCPDHYIGISPHSQEGPWIGAITPDEFPASNRNGHSLIVTGKFTGNWVEEDFRDENGEPEEWLYKMPEFKIISWKENELDYNSPPPKVISQNKEIIGSWNLVKIEVDGVEKKDSIAKVVIWDFRVDSTVHASVPKDNYEGSMNWVTKGDSIFINDKEFPNEHIIGTWHINDDTLNFHFIMNNKSSRRMVFARIEESFEIAK